MKMSENNEENTNNEESATIEAEAPVETTESVDAASTTPEEEVEVDPSADPDLADGSGEDFKWYIAKTLTGQENKIAKALKERILNYKKTEFFSKIVVPEETVVTNAGGKKRTIKKVAILGSGIMGSGIACHFANIGVEVLILDIVPRELNDAEKTNWHIS
jgi:NADPH-dependent 2,4-dienoyl-CoA reductase/sulfur reductase-like enzyme